jgi:hypothetical protein
MKIAYCLSGHTRGFDSTLSEANIKIKKYNIFNFYISTWKNSGLNKVFWKGEQEGSDQIDTESMVHQYNPIIWDAESRENYKNFNFHNVIFNNSPHQVNVLNTLLMFKKIKKCISYVSGDYDIVVRSRFDLQDIDFDFTKIKCDPGKIYGKLSSINGMPSDIFFYGDRLTMTGCVPDENFYTKEIIESCINAEDVFSRYLKSKNILFICNNNLNYLLKGVSY